MELTVKKNSTPRNVNEVKEKGNRFKDTGSGSWESE